MNEQPEVFSAAHLRSLKVGDSFYTPGLFLGVTPEGLRWEVTGVPPKWGPKEYIQLQARYMGILVGVFSAAISKKGSVTVNATK